MKKTIATLAILSTLMLTGCYSGNTDADTGDKTSITEVHVTLNDGRNITCMQDDNGYAGGLSCDWAGAK